MAIGISPLVDFAFKLVLGNPDYPQVTIHFLNAILQCQPRINEVTILNPYLGKESLDDKELILDIRARDEQGREINIEMQTSLPQAMAERLTYYAASLFVDQLYSGEDYGELNPAICICVFSKSMFPHVPEMHLDFRLRDRRNGLTLTNVLQVHLLELPKCRATADNVTQAEPLDQWAFFLQHADQLAASEIARLLPAPEFDAAAGVLEMISRSSDEKMRYEARLKFQRDERAKLAYAQTEGREEGLREGRAIGLEMGRSEGRLEGKQEGKQEGKLEGQVAGEVRAYQKILGLPESTSEELAALGLEAATRLAGELLQRVLDRNKPTPS